MRQVFAAPLGKNVSALGFGCASLGSRVSASEGLAALSRAYDHGVTWFDVAPPYGDGRAETLLGQFLRGRRSNVVICTKVGIEPPQVSMKAQLLKPLMRVALKGAPRIRNAIAKHRPASVREPVDSRLIEASVTRSLRKLGVDHIDVLALHEPLLDDIQREDVRGALQRLVEKGYARVIGIAGDRAVAEQGIADFPLYRMVQFADGPFEAPLPLHKVLRVTHSVFGVSGALAKLTQAVTSDETLRAKLADLDFNGPIKEVAASALLDFALSNNRDGIVLASMFHTSHLERNIGRTSRPPNDAIVCLLRNIFRGSAL